MKGDIHADWIIAFFVFLVFVSWSFQYYTAMSHTRGVDLSQPAEGITDTILDNITVRVYDTPASYTSQYTQANGVMNASYYWNSDGEKNTTMVLSNTSAQLPCRLSGNSVYWKSDVAAGANNFTIRVSNRSAGVMNCTGTFDLSGANFTIARASGMKIMLSQAAIGSMSAIGYEGFKSAIGISRSFRLQFDTDAYSASFGSALPNIIDVFSNQRWFKSDENQTSVKVTVMVW